MPRVPTFQEQQRLRGGNPTGFRNTGSARIPGESIEAAGRGLENLAKGYNDYMNRLNSARKSLDARELKAILSDKAQEISMRLSRDGTDGNGDVDKFNQEMEAFSSKVLMENFGGGNRELGIVSKEITNSFRPDIYKVSMEKNKNAMGAKLTKMDADFSALAYNAPDRIEQTVMEYRTDAAVPLITITENDQITKDKLRNGSRALVDTSIKALVNRRDSQSFELAEKTLKQFGAFYGTKERTDMENYIRNERVKFETEDHTRWVRNRTKTKAAIEDMDEKSLEVLGALNREGDNFELAKDIRNHMINSGELSLKGTNEAFKIEEYYQQQRTSELAVDVFYSALAEGKDRKQLMGQVKRAALRGEIDHAKAAEMIRQLKASQANSTRPGFTAADRNLARDYLRTNLTQQNAFGIDINKDNVRRFNEAMFRVEELATKGLNGKVIPYEDAAKIVYARFGLGQFKKVPITTIPGVDASEINSPEKVGVEQRKITTLYNQNTMTKEDFIKKMEALEQHKQMLLLEKEINTIEGKYELPGLLNEILLPPGDVPSPLRR